MTQELIIFGASGHGKVVADIALKAGLRISLIVDDAPVVKELGGVRVASSQDEAWQALNQFQFVVLCAGAIVNPGAHLHDNCIINTGASVDHDCEVGPHAHLCPGVRLAGNVTVGEGPRKG